jgi:hypothetical protein
MRGYRFEIRSSHAFTISPGKPLDVAVVVYPKDPTRPLEERPAVQWFETNP